VDFPAPLRDHAAATAAAAAAAAAGCAGKVCN